MSSFSSTNNNSKIAAGPLSGNEVSLKGGAQVAIYLSHDDEECEDQSETDDEEERLDCVHDIHGDGEEADVEEVDGDDDDEKEYRAICFVAQLKTRLFSITNHAQLFRGCVLICV